MSPDSLPLDQLPGVSPARRDLLGRLGLATVGDLLFHFPSRYEDLTDLRPIAQLAEGTLQTVQGEVVEIESRPTSNGGFLVSVVLSDDNVHVLEGVWFNQEFAARRFRFGQRVSFSGKPKWYRDHWQIGSPRVQILDGTDPTGPGIVPVYPLTEDLRPEVLRSLVERALQDHAAAVVEVLPANLREQHGWPEVGPALWQAHTPETLESAANAKKRFVYQELLVLQVALRQVHVPETLDSADIARKRFIYQELLVLQVALALRRRESRDEPSAPPLPVTPAIDGRIRRLFPFPLTGDQDRAIAEICHDMAGERPMQRLLQADVGAGKTAVAVYAMLVAVANKHQSALMAPTEVLARQHFRTLDRYLAHSRVRRLLLTGGMSAPERRQALAALRAGEIDLVVGTQALVQEAVQFAKLGLVVIDEQHKFGVNQRAGVRRLGDDPHYLVMTATPIPRTVALTVFGDLDISIIRQLPPGRQVVTTRWLRGGERDGLNARLDRAMREGRQVYVVCPAVEDSATQVVRSVATVYHELSGTFRDFRLGLLHGRMDEDVKADVMDRFRRREIDLLVTTTVIEVGVDVPNATYLVVEDSERFGLSQLHQLRGRVSRGTTPGYCYLFADPPTDEGRERLRVLMRTTDGFALAEEDAKLRGSGELFGTKQHGAGELWALAQAGTELLDLARRDAFALVAADPKLSRPEHAALRQAVYSRYGKTLELAEVG